MTVAIADTTTAGLTTRVTEGRLRTTVSLWGVLGLGAADALAAALADAVWRKPRQVVVECAGLTDVTHAASVEPFAAAARVMQARQGRLWIGGDSRALRDALTSHGVRVVAHPGSALAELVP